MSESEFKEKIVYDTLEDMRNERKFLKRLSIFLCSFIIILISGIIITTVYTHNKIFKFLNETEFESTSEINNNNSTNYGNITRN